MPKETSNSLKPIERNYRNELPRMNEKELKRARKLIQETCANVPAHDIGLKDRVECPQMNSYTVLCRWFRWVILPQDEDLEATITAKATTTNTKACCLCGKRFTPQSNRAKYCVRCRQQVQRKQKAFSERKRRAKPWNDRASKTL